MDACSRKTTYGRRPLVRQYNRIPAVSATDLEIWILLSSIMVKTTGRVMILAITAVLTWSGDAVGRQATGPVDSVSVEGVLRASALVDSVFIDRTLLKASIAPGDFAAYLLARLGVEPFPVNLGWRVEADSGVLRIQGRFQDIPDESRAIFGNLLLFMDSTTTLAAIVKPAPAGAGLARFRLDQVLVNGFVVPDFVMTSILTSVGRRYPALTESGRDLYLQVPPDGGVEVLPGSIRLSIRQPDALPSGRHLRR